VTVGLADIVEWDRHLKYLAKEYLFNLKLSEVIEMLINPIYRERETADNSLKWNVG
jgi:hypothetical protein|tara:strand:- start:120 stop:287 length:168 start_codon:yes stop_codon:yes gene_type:complete